MSQSNIVLTKGFIFAKHSTKEQPECYLVSHSHGKRCEFAFAGTASLPHGPFISTMSLVSSINIMKLIKERHYNFVSIFI